MIRELIERFIDKPQELPGRKVGVVCRVCPNRADVQLSSADANQTTIAIPTQHEMLCYEHLGQFIEIWTGDRREFYVVKL